MDKVKLAPAPYLFPMPTTVVGANVSGRPNYLAAAFCGIVDYKPPTVAVALSAKHHTCRGIRENGTFSVNIPSTAQVVATDYVGIYSGDKVDKSRVFDAFYGELKSAPMARECPLNLECRLTREIALASDVLFLGEIVRVYASPAALTDGKPDIVKLDPILFGIEDSGYYRLGKRFAGAWEVGETWRAAE